jgi:hypothetical protein
LRWHRGPVLSPAKAHQTPMTIQVSRNSPMSAPTLLSDQPAERHALGSSPRAARAIDSSPELGESIVNTNALRGRSPRPWAPGHRDIRGQTRTLPPQEPDATAHISSLLARRPHPPG